MKDILSAIQIGLIFASIILVQLISCGPCTLPNGRSSQCERIHLCDDIWNYVKTNGNNQRTRNYVKDYQVCPEGQSFVCCPNLATTTTQSANQSPVQTSPAQTSSVQQPVARPFNDENGAKIPLRSNFDLLSRHPNFKVINSPDCGISTKTRILNGNETEIKEYPWNALLGYKEFDDAELQWNCGGTLIAERYVLTAAHCFVRNMKLATVRLGEHNILTNPDCDVTDDNERDCADLVQDIPVESTIPHENYSRNKVANDIALVKLARKPNFRVNNVKTICLPTTKLLANSKPDKFIITGWGNTETGKRSNTLLQATVPTVANDVCQRRFVEGNKRVDVYTSIICAGGADNNVDSCHGDSGGPIQWTGRVDAGIPRFVQFGVVSAGTECNRYKTKFFPGVYTDLTYYMEWILDNISR